MIGIIDNGKGAEEIRKILHVKTKIMKPSKIEDAVAYVISDGVFDKTNQKKIFDIIKTNKPILGIGLGAMYLCSKFGSKFIESKPNEKQEKVIINHHCPLFLNMKKFFVVHKKSLYRTDEIPENIDVTGVTNNNEPVVFQDIENPWFGVNFNPELGLDGRLILNNFIKFIEVWKKYHK